MKFTSLKFILVGLCLYASSATAQIILVNGQPTEVEIQNNELTKIKGKVTGHMTDYRSAPSDKFTKVSPRLDEIITSKAVLAESDNISGSTINNLKTVSFDDQSTFIDKDGQKFLDNIVSTIKSGKSTTILLKSWYKSGDKSDIALTRQRLDACKRYLEDQGIISNLILTSMVAKSDKSADIAVFMK